HRQLGHRLATSKRGFTNLVIGNSGADADVHGALASTSRDRLIEIQTQTRIVVNSEGESLLILLHPPLRPWPRSSGPLAGSIMPGATAWQPRLLCRPWHRLHAGPGHPLRQWRKMPK